MSEDVIVAVSRTSPPALPKASRLPILHPIKTELLLWAELQLLGIGHITSVPAVLPVSAGEVCVLWLYVQQDPATVGLETAQERVQGSAWGSGMCRRDASCGWNWTHWWKSEPLFTVFWVIWEVVNSPIREEFTHWWSTIPSPSSSEKAGKCKNLLLPQRPLLQGLKTTQQDTYTWLLPLGDASMVPRARMRLLKRHGPPVCVCVSIEGVWSCLWCQGTLLIKAQLIFKNSFI